MTGRPHTVTWVPMPHDNRTIVERFLNMFGLTMEPLIPNNHFSEQLIQQQLIAARTLKHGIGGFQTSWKPKRASKFRRLASHGRAA